MKKGFRSEQVPFLANVFFTFCFLNNTAILEILAPRDKHIRNLVWNKSLSQVESNQESLEQILASETKKWTFFAFHNLSEFHKIDQSMFKVLRTFV